MLHHEEVFVFSWALPCRKATRFPGSIKSKGAPSSLYEIRVSSNILISVSPLFDAMLNGQFREGQRKSDDNDPPVVEPPEDQAPAMLALCHLLHLQEEHVPIRLATGMDHHTIATMAQICDKYSFKSVTKS
jgi:hypothetical protein